MKKTLCLLAIAILSFSLFAALPKLTRNSTIEFSTDKTVSGTPITFDVDRKNSTVLIACGSINAASNSLQLLINRSNGSITVLNVDNSRGVFSLSDKAYQSFIDVVRSGSVLALVIKDNTEVYAKASLEMDVSLFNSLMSSSSDGEYRIGDRGPAGGFVFYDKGVYSDGWRYLEASPADVRVVSGSPSCDSSDLWYDFGEAEYIFGQYAKTLDGLPLFVNGERTFNASTCTSKKVGAGKSNTQKMVSCMGDKAVVFVKSATLTTKDYPAKICLDLEYNGFDDWYLPSIDELSLLYENLFYSGLCEYEQYSVYWSSTEYEGHSQFVYVFPQSYDPGSYCRPNTEARVRAIRYF